MKNKVNWDVMIKNIFGDNIPSKYTWNNSNDIIQILNIIGKSNNQMLLPTGGDLEICFSCISKEPACINLFTTYNSFDIVKPCNLTFFSLGGNHEFDFFKLEIDNLDPRGVYNNNDELTELVGKEEVILLENGNYLNRDLWDTGFYIDQFGNEKSFTEKDHIVCRYLRKGSFLFIKQESFIGEVLLQYEIELRNGRKFIASHDELGDNLFEYIQKIKEFVENK